MNKFLWPIRVYYEDTDSGGVVYHSTYLNFMERARTEWLRDMGFEQDELISRQNVLFAVRSIAVDYRLPARFNDSLLVSVEAVEINRASMVLEQSIIKAGHTLALCTGTVTIASLNVSSFKPCALPVDLREKIIRGE